MDLPRLWNFRTDRLESLPEVLDDENATDYLPEPSLWIYSEHRRHDQPPLQALTRTIIDPRTMTSVIGYWKRRQRKILITQIVITYGLLVLVGIISIIWSAWSGWSRSPLELWAIFIAGQIYGIWIGEGRPLPTITIRRKSHVQR